MKVKKIIRQIETCFHDYHVDVKLQLLSVTKEQVFLFQVIPKSGIRQKNIFSAYADVQSTLRIPVFHLYKNEFKLLLAISWKKSKIRSLIAMLKSSVFSDCNFPLPIALGYDVLGNIAFDDLSEMSCLIIGGAGNSGKSVALKCLISTLIVANTVEQLSLLIIDVGADSLDLFQTVPHLAHPIVKDAKTASYIIHELVEEMNRRNKSETDLKDLPKIVCVVDEFISLINIIDKTQAEELKAGFLNLITRGRHMGIHIVLAAQNPTKENLVIDLASTTARMAFRCAKVQNSVTILGEGGAEKLTQKGAFLYQSPTRSETIQYQGPYISDEEVKLLIGKVIDSNIELHNQFAIETFDKTKREEIVGNALIATHDCEENSELAQIIMQVLSTCRNVSVNRLKKAFGMGNRANDIMDSMCRLGIVSGKNANKPRDVLPNSINDIPKETIDFLNRNGFSSKKVSEVLQKKAETDNCYSV